MMTRSPYHLGFTTLAAEVDTQDLPIRGTFPQWLTGTLIRTGPAKFEVGEHPFKHWFDGLAMLHRFAFVGGRVCYLNRYLHSQAYDQATATGVISRREFATDPCRTLFQRVTSWFFPEPFTDNGSVNIAQWHDVMVALTETRLPVRFDPETLTTVGLREYGGHVKGAVSTAHPHFDRTRRCHYTYLVDFGWRSKYHVVAIDDTTGKETVVATIPVDRPAYMHSFGMTQRYLILTEFPLVVNPLKLLLSGQPFIQNYQWQPERGVRLHIVEKDSGRLVRSVRGEPFFAFHHVNAFEDGDEILLDIVTRDDASIIDQLYLDKLRANVAVDPTGKLMRFQITPGKEVFGEQLTDVTIELPRFDYGHRAGVRHRFVYGAAQAATGQFFDSLVKIDLDQNRTASWHEAGCYPGEPIFVADPKAANEDDGVILSIVLDTRRGASFLVILNASTFTELARAEAPHHIPFSFHGNYLAGNRETG